HRARGGRPGAGVPRGQAASRRRRCGPVTVVADNGGVTDELQTAPKPKARDLNELVRYTMWSVFRVADRAALEAGGPGEAAAEVAELLDQAAGKGIVTRGCYDIQGLRADADFMFWWVAATSGELQALPAPFPGPRLGRCSEPVWSVMALHRP